MNLEFIVAILIALNGTLIFRSTILALIAHGHAMEHKPDAYIGDVHG